ncbi:MAG: diacylglycerol kinase [Patescibacteria group bacterium]|nr:diacylglycerol kinase [Patescibacteria group bacterium]
MNLSKFFKSFRYAFHGLYLIAKGEQSFRVQLLIGTVVIILVVVFPLEAWERILMILMVSAVLVLEVINSIFERISDALKPRLHPMVKEVKDMMAGAVLLTSVTAVVVAVLIFYSYFI